MAQDSARTIVPVMAFATGLALFGHETEAKTGTSKLSPKVGDAQILLGGTIAAVILTLLSMGGEVGAKFSKGLAVVTLLSAIGLYGTSIVKGIDNLTGQSIPAAEGQKPATTTTKKKAP